MVKRALIFPGQGSQYVGMGKKLCENFKVAEETYQEASEALGLDIKKMCAESNMAELTLSKNAQPAILVTSVAMYNVFKQEEEIKPNIMAGHSLGEISALTCAGAIDLSDAVKIVRKRGEFMQEAVTNMDTKMTAILCRDAQKIEKLCEKISTESDVVAISNYNSRSQIVISGSRKAVDMVIQELESDNVKSKELNVSAPFHTVLMKPAAEKLKEELSKYQFNDLEYPVLSNVSTQPYTGKESICDNLYAQVYKPVKWNECMFYLKKAMVLYGIEMGAGHVLKQMMKGNYSDIKIYAYDNEKDIEKMRVATKMSYLPFLSRSLGIACATKNHNCNQEEYTTGVVAPYKEIVQLKEQVESENKEVTKDEMEQAIRMLKKVFKTKGTNEEERIKRFKELFCDTGTERLFESFDYSDTII